MQTKYGRGLDKHKRLLARAQVKAVCEQQTRDKKVIVFKKKKRKGYRRKNGFRRHISVLRVTKVDLKPDTTPLDPPVSETSSKAPDSEPKAEWFTSTEVNIIRWLSAIRNPMENLL